MENYNINGKILIGIDHGYGNMKTRHVVFKSGVKKYDKEPAVAGSVLEFGDKFYVIGEDHKVFNVSKDKDDDYYILTLAAVAKELEFRGMTSADVILVVGLPLYWVSEQKEDFKKYLLKNEEVDYKFCGEEYHIKICNVEVYPQGFAGIAADINNYDGVNMLADIGNGTMNTLTIINGRGISDKMYTDQIGVHQCVMKIRNEVQAKCKAHLHEQVIEEFLRYGVTTASDDIQNVMRTVAEEYVQSIFDKLKEYEYDPDLVKLHIIGGGGCLVKNFGHYNPDRVEIIRDICATAKGYENIYMSMYERNLRRG